MTRIRITAIFDDDGDYEALMQALSEAGLEGIEAEEDLPPAEPHVGGGPKSPPKPR